MRNGSNNSGMILISVLWILAILSLLALSLGRRSGIELSLTQYGVARVKAYAAAKAGIYYAINRLEQLPSVKDSLFSTGIAIPANKSLEVYFSGVRVSDESSFEISYNSKDYGKSSKHFGLTDETRRINLNALNSSNVRVLGYLLQEVGVERGAAEAIATTAVDWKDEDTNVLNMDGTSASAQEEDYYKNKPFDAPEELMMVKGMTPEIYSKIENYITVYPQIVPEGVLQINVNTAPDAVIHAVLKEAEADSSNGMMVNVSTFMQTLARSRAGRDQRLFTQDDGLSDIPEGTMRDDYMKASQAASGIDKSKYYRIRSVGIEKSVHARVIIEAIVSNETGSWIVKSWRKS